MALEVTLLKQPHEVSFSGNPIVYTFALSPYSDTEKAQDIRLQVRILVEKSYNSGIFSEVKSQYFYPDASGMFTIDAASIIDPFLEYYTPKPTLTRPVQAIHQRKRFKISWLLQRDSATVGSVQESSVCYAIKGGMAYEHWHASEFFTSVITAKKPLMFSANGEKFGMEETRFLFWCYPYSDNAVQSVIFAVNGSDGTTYTLTLSGTVFCGKWGVLCVPVGFKQMNLQSLLPAGVLAISYSVKVVAGSTEVVAPYTFTIDHRNFYKTYQLLYRNSVGGLETIRLRGQVDLSADFDFQQVQRTVPPSYFSNMILRPQTVQSAQESFKCSGDTSFLSEEAMQKLRDLFLSEERYELDGGKLIPVVLNNKTVKFYTNKDNLLSLQVEWQHAFVNEFFTPKNMMPATRVCPTVESLVVKQVTKNYLQIMYALPMPYDRIEVQLVIGSDTLTYVYSGNTGMVRQVFSNPSTGAPVSITVKGRVLCDEDNGDAGPFTTLSLNVISNSVPVAANDTFNINSGYTSARTLEGSVLTNDYDADADPIEVVASSGATDKGGTYSITAEGVITYTPPSSTFTGQDFFVYQVREVGSTDPVNATVYINVGTAAVGVFAKIVYRNEQYSNESYGTSMFGEVWVDFFGDPAASQPLNVTSYNLTVNIKTTYNQTVNDVIYDPMITNSTINPAAERVLLFEGQISEDRYGDNGSSNGFGYTFQIMPGSGYTVI